MTENKSPLQQLTTDQGDTDKDTAIFPQVESQELLNPSDIPRLPPEKAVPMLGSDDQLIMPGDAEKAAEQRDWQTVNSYRVDPWHAYIGGILNEGITSTPIIGLQTLEKNVMKHYTPEAVPYVEDNMRNAREQMANFNDFIHKSSVWAKIGAWVGKRTYDLALNPINVGAFWLVGGYAGIFAPNFEAALAEDSGAIGQAVAKGVTHGVEGAAAFLPDSGLHWAFSKTGYNDGFNSLDLMHSELAGAFTFIGTSMLFRGIGKGYKWFNERKLKDNFNRAQIQMETGNNVDVTPATKNAFNDARLDPENLSKLEIFTTKTRLEKILEKVDTNLKNKIDETNELYKTESEEKLTPFEISYRKLHAAAKVPEELTDFEKEKLPTLEETDAIKNFDKMFKDRLSLLDEDNWNEIETQQRFSKSLEGRPIEEAHQDLDDLFKKRDDLRQDISRTNLALKLSDGPLNLTSEEELMGKYQKNLSAENQNLFDANNDEWENELERIKSQPETAIPQHIQERVDNIEKLPEHEDLLNQADTNIKRESAIKNLMHKLAKCLGG